MEIGTAMDDNDQWAAVAMPSTMRLWASLVK